MKNKQANTASRVTVYRLKTVPNSVSIADYNKVAESTDPGSGYTYSLWFGDHPEDVPNWYPPFSGIASAAPTVKQAGFILLVNTSNATYACTGGLGYHKLFDSFQIEPRFGLIVARKVMSVQNIKGVSQKDATGVVNSLERAFRAPYNPSGDIDNLHRVLTALRATFDKGSSENATIGSSVRAGDSLCANKARTFPEILAFIKSVDALWNSTTPGLAIPELERINPKHEQALIAALNEELAKTILDSAPGNGGMAGSLFLDNTGMGYLPDRVSKYILSYNRTTETCDTYEEVFEWVAKALAAGSAGKGARYGELERVRARLKFDDGYENKDKPLVHYICGDIVLNNEAYFLSNGLWFKANANFIAKISEELDELLYLPANSVCLTDWVAKDEDGYNTTQAGNGNGLILLDKHLVRVSHEKGPIEFCDLLLSQNGMVNLIHVKHACGAELRALFAQGYVSAHLYSESSEFRSKIHKSDIDMAGNLSGLDKNALAGLASRPRREFQIVYAIYDDEPNHTASTGTPLKVSDVLGRTLTLFAKIDLLARVQAIRSMGYNVALTRIGPY